METKEELKKISYFAGLSKKEVDELAKITRTIKYSSGMILFMEQDEPSGLFMLVDGKVKVYKISEDGRNILLEVIHSGTSFGEVAVFDGKPFPANAEAMTDVIVLFITRNEFMEFLKKFPDVAMGVIEDLGGRLRYAQNRIRSLITKKAEGRLASIILKLSQKLGKKQEGKLILDLPLTRLDLAEMAGITQETAIRILSKWQKEGVIVFRSKRLEVILLQEIKQKAHQL